MTNKFQIEVPQLCNDIRQPDKPHICSDAYLAVTTAGVRPNRRSATISTWNTKRSRRTWSRIGESRVPIRKFGATL